MSTKGLKVRIPISGLFPSFDLIEKSVFSKLSSNNDSIELKNLSLIFTVSAFEEVKINI